MNDRPLISVVVPAYNHEQFIGEALRSLIAQTYPHLDLLVLDDGSTDTTYARIEELRPELVRRFSRVEIATKPNEGSGRTISRCLELVRNDLVYLLDSDDIAHPDAIDRLLSCMASSDVALAVGDNEYIDADGRPVAMERGHERYSTLLAYYTKPRADFSVEKDFGSYPSLIQGNYVPNGWLLRRACVADVGGYVLDLALDDWPLLLRLAKKYRLCFAGAVLGKCRVHEKNTLAVHADRLFLDTARILLQERAYCRQHGFEPEWMKHAQSVFARITPEQIESIVENPAADENWWEEKYSRIDDLVRIGTLQQDCWRVQADLDRETEQVRVSIAEQTRLQSSLDERAETVRTLVAKQTRLQSSLDERAETVRRLVAKQTRLQSSLDQRAETVRELAAEQTRLQSSLADSAEILRASTAEQTRLRTLHGSDRSQIESLLHDLTSSSARLAELESSRSWRWTEPLRRGWGALRRLETRSWEIVLESPRADPARLGGLILSGWAFHRRAPVTKIELSVHGERPFAAEYGIERPDVAAAFPRCDVGRPGFRAWTQVTEDPVTLQIKLFCNDGRTQIVHRKLRRTAAMNDQAREWYGAPNPFEASWLGFVRDRLRYGAIGADIWQSRRIRGWIRGQGEAEALAKASDSLGDSPVIVEVGTFLGCSTVLLAGPCKRRGSGRVHCVDAFSPIGDDDALPIYRAIAGSLGMPLKEAFEQNMRRAGLSDWITVHEMKSEEAARRWNTPIDMLFLDGDVSIAGSRDIFQTWSPFLRAGGILAINGTVDRSSTGSFRVVEEFVRPPAYENVRRVDHITFAMKSGRV
jgi:alpha-1,3-rhamnosyltransferase